MSRTGGDPHGVPGLARSWSEGRPAPGVEGAGKGREPPADGSSDQALASEGLSRRQAETRTTGNTNRHKHERPPATRTRPPHRPPTTGANHPRKDGKVTLWRVRQGRSGIGPEGHNANRASLARPQGKFILVRGHSRPEFPLFRADHQITKYPKMSLRASTRHSRTLGRVRVDPATEWRCVDETVARLVARRRDCGRRCRDCGRRYCSRPGVKTAGGGAGTGAGFGVRGPTLLRVVVVRVG